MSNKISVITVVFNDVCHIRETIESYFTQTWNDKEYIIIDGGSTDGTAEIISEYSDRLAFWCSEPDGGIYDAMNKGLNHCTGEWINILNSGDTYVSADSLKSVMVQADIADYDVVYGDSIQVSETDKRLIQSGTNLRQMNVCPIYRHGSSLVKTEVQRKYPYRLSLADRYGFALDWDCIFNMYHDGCRFKKVKVRIENYLADGISNSVFDTLKYNFRITSQYGLKHYHIWYYGKNFLKEIAIRLKVYRFATAFFGEYIPNSVLSHIPFWKVRLFYLKMIGAHIGKQSLIMKKNTFLSPRSIVIGSGSHINQGCILDARGGIEIGNNVSISHKVSLMTGGHDYRSLNFIGTYDKITVEDYVWIGVGATVLQGVTIGKGAVIGAGAIVTKNVEPYSVVAGVPAKEIGIRPKNLNYKCIWSAPFS